MVRASAQTTQPEDLNSFAIAARAIECFGLGQRPGYVTGLSFLRKRYEKEKDGGKACKELRRRFEKMLRFADDVGAQARKKGDPMQAVALYGTA